MSNVAAPVSFAVPIADVGELPADQYVGLIDPEAIACLTVRLAAQGLLTPIWVRRNGNAAKHRWSVIAGRHRLLAAAQLGWTEIAAQQRADASASPDKLRRLQIAENLDRRDLRPIERARFVMDRWCEAASRILPDQPASQQSRAIRTRWEAVSHTPVGARRAVDQATAADCGGRTDRWVRTYRAIYEAIVVGLPDHFEALNTVPLGANLRSMETLAGFPEAKRLAAAEAILANPECDSLKQVLENAGIEGSNGNSVDPNKPDATFLGAWSKMHPVRRRVTALAWAKQVTPSEILEIVQVWKDMKVVGDKLTIV